MGQTKETKEVVLAFLALAEVMAASFKDGVQVSDLAVVLEKCKQEPLASMLKAAYQDIELVKTEVKEVSAMDIIVLMPDLVPAIIKLVESIKK